MSIYIVPTLVCLTVALVAFFLGRWSDRRARPRRDRRFESWSDPQKQVWHALQHALCDLDAVWTRKDCYVLVFKEIEAEIDRLQERAQQGYPTGDILVEDLDKWPELAAIYYRWKWLQILRNGVGDLGLEVLEEEQKAKDYIEFVDDHAEKLGMFKPI